VYEIWEGKGVRTVKQRPGDAMRQANGRRGKERKLQGADAADVEGRGEWGGLCLPGAPGGAGGAAPRRRGGGRPRRAGLSSLHHLATPRMGSRGMVVGMHCAVCAIQPRRRFFPKTQPPFHQTPRWQAGVATC
jgi:hypothetical protein